MDLNKALEIHGCFVEDQEDDSSLSGKSEFDDEYFAQQPPPIVIDRSKVTVIVPEIEYINTNSSAKEKNSKTSSTIIPSHHQFSGDRGSPSLSHHHSTFGLNYATREIVDSDNPALANNVPKANEIETRRVSIPIHQPPRSAQIPNGDNRNVLKANEIETGRVSIPIHQSPRLAQIPSDGNRNVLMVNEIETRRVSLPNQPSIAADWERANNRNRSVMPDVNVINIRGSSIRTIQPSPVSQISSNNNRNIPVYSEDVSRGTSSTTTSFRDLNDQGCFMQFFDVITCGCCCL